MQKVRSLMSIGAGLTTCGVGVCYAADIHPLGMCVTHIVLGLILVVEGGIILLHAAKLPPTQPPALAVEV